MVDTCTNSFTQIWRLIRALLKSQQAPNLAVDVLRREEALAPDPQSSSQNTRTAKRLAHPKARRDRLQHEGFDFIQHGVGWVVYGEQWRLCGFTTVYGMMLQRFKNLLKGWVLYIEVHGDVSAQLNKLYRVSYTVLHDF